MPSSCLQRPSSLHGDYRHKADVIDPEWQGEEVGGAYSRREGLSVDRKETHARDSCVRVCRK